MFGFSMIQTVRHHASKVDRPLRQKLMNLYRPFRWVPCFLHKGLETILKKTKKVPLIIEFNHNENFQMNMNEVFHLTNQKFRCHLKREFPSVHSCSADLTPDAIEQLLTSNLNVKRIYLDREVRALLDHAVPTIQAKNVEPRQDQMLTGQGINIAVIDTGVYDHQDLENRIIAFKDFIKNKTSPYDDNGHGTHCAGCVAANGASSDEKYQGPAPKANIIGVKVLDKMGSGSLSTVMDGVQWCIDNKDEYDINIISMSLGAAPEQLENEDKDPMVQIVEAAWAAGIVVVVAAGNDGPEAKTIATPGISNEIITVGAMDDKNSDHRSDDVIASFSSRGPTIYGVEKPDIVAPGVNIISLRSPNSYLDKLQKSNRVGEHYFTLSGTSMATPICAGAIALLLEDNPHLTPEEVKVMLLKNAYAEIGNDPNIYGAGYVDVQDTV